MDTHGQPRTSCVCWWTPTDVPCVPNRQPTWAKITRTVHGKGQRAESKDQRTDMCTDGQPRTSRVTNTDVLCVLTDTHGRPVCADGHTRTQKDHHRRPVCADGEPQTATDVLCVLADTHGRPVYSPRGPKITQTVHGKGQRAESKDQRADIQPTWAKITRAVHGKGQCAESKDQRADMCADGQPRTSSTDVLCVLVDTHGRPRTWAKITRTVHGKGQRAESKDQCANMCTDGQPRTSCVF
ncbi:unnamed protein product [Brassica rapa]|uniref:Uncharacterized protein n=1 Tax=Brassica campestris TaxID=3711 RepID=A0A8D9G0F7_BRACM|nr:unnamed protein product [Brassica rapa]